MTTKTHTKPKPAPVDYTAIIKEMRNDIFMTAWRMQATVADALTASRSGLHELAQGHLQEMDRILQSTMARYR
jgi:hypothetical protein